MSQPSDPLRVAQQACEQYWNITAKVRDLDGRLGAIDREVAILEERAHDYRGKLIHLLKQTQARSSFYGPKLSEIASRRDVNQLEVLEALQLLWKELDCRSAEEMADMLAGIKELLMVAKDTSVILRGYPVISETGWYGQRLARQPYLRWANDVWWVRLVLRRKANETPVAVRIDCRELNNVALALRKRGVYIGEPVISGLIAELSEPGAIDAATIPFVRAAVEGAGLAGALCDSLIGG